MSNWDSNGIPIIDVNSLGSARFYDSHEAFLKRMDELAPQKKSYKEKVMLWFNKIKRGIKTPGELN